MRGAIRIRKIPKQEFFQLFFMEPSYGREKLGGDFVASKVGQIDELVVLFELNIHLDRLEAIAWKAGSSICGPVFPQEYNTKLFETECSCGLASSKIAESDPARYFGI